MRSTSNAEAQQSVVIPGLSAASSVACLRSFGKQGAHTILVTESPRVPARYSKYCDEVVLTPNPADDIDSYRDTLLALAKRPDVQTILPLRELDVYALAKHRDAFAEHVATPWPDFETLRRAQDRKLLFEAAERAGVPIPQTQLLSEVTDWSLDRIVKPRFALVTSDFAPGVEPNCVVPVGTTQHLDPGVAPDVDAIQASMHHDPIVQEFIPGTEYCYRALFDHGELVSACQKHQVRGIKYYRGPSVYHETADSSALREAGAALLRELGWHGIASVTFIEDARTGEFKLLEVNTRFWASLQMDIHAGADFPAHYWALALGNREQIVDSYVAGAGTHKLFGEVAHLHSVLFDDDSHADRPSVAGTVRDMASSLVRQPNFDVLSLDDPKPFLAQCLDEVTDAIGFRPGTVTREPRVYETETPAVEGGLEAGPPT